MSDQIPQSTETAQPESDCLACATTTGTKRYCAPTRCYCGHPECYAFDSYVDLSQVQIADHAPTTTKRGRSAWDDREGATWIDSL